VFSIVRNTDYVVLSVNIENVMRMIKQITKNDIDQNEVIRAITPKNIDIISFVNDLALKSKVGAKYVISDEIESYHPNDYIYHQCKYNDGICNIFIKDAYDEILMGTQGDTGAEDCPGTKKTVEFYKSSYDKLQMKVLNKNSLFVRNGGGIYSVIERNIAEFIVYLTWVKLNDVMRIVKARYPDINVDLASSYEVVEREDGIVFDIVRKFKESKDTSFFMIDGKTGNKVKMMVDTSIPEISSDLTSTFYYNEFIKNMESYRNGTVGSLTGAIKSADNRIKRSMSVGIKTGLQLANTLLKQGWVIETGNNGVDCFVYPHKVYITAVVGGDGMKRYTFPEECRDKLYLYDITVPIDALMYGISNREHGVKARGFHPHRSSGSSNFYGDLDHITDLNAVCIGDLDGKPIEKIVNLIDALSSAYQPSMMGNAASTCVTMLFGREFNVMSSDAKKAEVKATMEYIDPFVKNNGILRKPIVVKDDTSTTKKKKDSGEPVMRTVKSGSVFTVK
jgi:hypothetical protein